MSGLSSLFEECRAEGRSALIGYLPTGFPDVPTSISAMTAMVESGCDIIEVGIAYSDPGMDGPVIAAATEAALRGGVRVRDALAAVEAISKAGGRAVVMTYWNPVLRWGVDAFARDLASAGGLGMITPDLIPDEADEWLAVSDARDLDRIFLVAPSSTPERLAATVQASRGFGQDTYSEVDHSSTHRKHPSVTRKQIFLEIENRLADISLESIGISALGEGNVSLIIRQQVNSASYD